MGMVDVSSRSAAAYALSAAAGFPGIESRPPERFPCRRAAAEPQAGARPEIANELNKS